MPLAYEVHQALTIPASAYNSDDIATILGTGGRYGGQWVLKAVLVQGGEPRFSDPILGEMLTAKDDRPDMAVDTAYVWVNDACVKAGVKLAASKNLNSSYDAESAPYFASATFFIDRRG
jgi:hypothetical protein